MELLWFPVIVVVQFFFTTGLALLLAALTVHFRDIKDLLANLLTLWFFSTPIIYSMQMAPESYRWVLNLNPMTHLAISYQEVLFHVGPARPLEVAAGARRRLDRGLPGRLLRLRPAARFVRRGSVRRGR